MAWTTIKWLNLRLTVAYVTDGANQVCIPGNSAGAQTTPQPYFGAAGSNSPFTLNGDTFNAGWPGATTAGGQARNRSTGVDVRLAGQQLGYTSPTTVLTFEVQAGTAAGKYNIWLGVTDQGGYGFPSGTIAVADANGTLSTITLPSGHASGTAVCDATGTAYASSATWAAASGGGGNSIQVTSADTSNGNGGPLLQFICSVPLPLATVGIQYAGSSGGSTLPVLNTFNIGKMGLRN